MTLAELWTWTRARWQIVAGALVVIVLVVTVWLYGRAQYQRGQSIAAANIADSVSKAYESRFRALADSTARELAQMRLDVAASSKRADSAIARASAVEAHAQSVLTPTVIARTDPAVLALIADMRGVIHSDSAVIADQRAQLERQNGLTLRLSNALALADTTIAKQRETIVDLRATKDRPHGFWHTVGQVAEVTGAVTVGLIAGVAIAH